MKRKETREVNRTHTEIPVKPNPHPTTPHCVIPAKAGIHFGTLGGFVCASGLREGYSATSLVFCRSGFQPPPPIPAFAGMKGYAGMTEKEQKGAR